MRFPPGAALVMREVFRGRIWAARPMVCVRDDDQLTVLWFPHGAKWFRPCGQDGVPLRVPTETWKLVETRWERGDNLIIVRPGSAHAVHAFFDNGVHGGWYVNLQEPLRRSALGFDYMDRALDIIADPDCTAWQWKDQDEIIEWINLGYISEEDASEVWAEGERVIADIRTRSGVFSEGWARWRPDPVWPLPELPQAWNRL